MNAMSIQWDKNTHNDETFAQLEDMKMCMESCDLIRDTMKAKWNPKLTRFPQAHSNDVVLCSLCPPRRWSDAGVGIGMLSGSPLLSAI